MIGFNDIIGNDLLKKQFSDAIKHERVSHAYILSGEKGIGKKITAEAFALNLLCDNRDEDGNACFRCPSCKKIMENNHPDVIRVTHEKPSIITVDEIREQLIDTIDIRPYYGKYKIYIVNDADLMNQQAQNALLKSLEEPPEYVVIMLLCQDEKNLLDTIYSRAFKIKLKPCTDSQIRKYLDDNFPQDEDRKDISVAFSRGNLGRAIYLMTSDEFLVWYHKIIKICKSVKNMDTLEIQQQIRELISECSDIYEALDLIQLWYRDLMMYKVTKDMNGLVFSNERKALMDLASLSSYEGIEEIMDAIETCRIRLKANVNTELALELLLLNMKEK